MARDDPTIYMRIPQELKTQLDEAAAKNRRSLTAEVVARLQHSLANVFYEGQVNVDRGPSLSGKVAALALQIGSLASLRSSQHTALLLGQDRLERLRHELRLATESYPDDIEPLRARMADAERSIVVAKEQLIATEAQLEKLRQQANEDPTLTQEMIQLFGTEYGGLAGSVLTGRASGDLRTEEASNSTVDDPPGQRKRYTRVNRRNEPKKED